MKSIRTAIAALGLLAIAPVANAAIIFSDNFNANTPNTLTVTTLPGWTVTGNIDLVGQSNPFGIGACPGVCVDLDGTNGISSGQLLSNSINFGAGSQVLVNFDVSGNQRGGSADVFFFELLFGAPLTYNNNIITGFAYGTTGVFTNNGSGVYSGTIAPGRGFLTYGYGFIPTVAGNFQLRFGTTSADNIGPILDNVSATQVPEPGTLALLGLGLAGLGLVRRRKQSA